MANTTAVKTCPHCKMEVDPKASRCPHCHGKIYQWTRGRKILAGVLGALLLFIIVGAASGGSSSSSTSSGGSTSSSVHQGDEGVLRVSDGGDVIVLRTSKLLDEYVKAAVNKDTYGMAQIIYNGGGFIVPSGTKVLVIDSTFTTRQVRILEGKFLAESGWVPMEFVQSQ